MAFRFHPNPFVCHYFQKLKLHYYQTYFAEAQPFAAFVVCEPNFSTRNHPFRALEAKLLYHNRFDVESMIQHTKE